MVQDIGFSHFYFGGSPIEGTHENGQRSRVASIPDSDNKALKGTRDIPCQYSEDYRADNTYLYWK